MVSYCVLRIVSALFRNTHDASLMLQIRRLAGIMEREIQSQWCLSKGAYNG